MADLQPLMEAVRDVARRAGDVALSYFRQGVRVETKADLTPVTEADRNAERTARAWIEEHFPGDGILGEEFGEAGTGAKRRWVVDPIDGTKSFIHGVPLWGTLVAVTEGDRVLAGCAYFPPVGELLVAAPGAGAFWNDKRCHVSQIDSVGKATVLFTDTKFQDPERARRWAKLTNAALLSRTWGDCFGYLLLATGRAEVMADDVVAPWDVAALLPIIEEAGGVITDWQGNRTWRGTGALATNAALAAEVRAMVGG
jgi:histidinol phosphatase-like enzyme (inositol monophosphatase family)